ncbi:MAG: hypothetical protein GX900_06060 [Clostridiaceae bacterium]|nr:hypothetical protein [Clostridiaceae bacterium]
MTKNKLSLVAMILGVIACIILFSAYTRGIETSNIAEKIGLAIGKAIVLPSLISTSIAALLNVIGYFTVNRTLTLISAIFYVLGLILMPLWGFVGIPSMILQFVAFANMKKDEPQV